MDSSEDLAFGLGFGFQRGMIQEYVFAGDYLLSRLDWDFASLWSIGTGLHFRTGGMVFGFSFTLGIPSTVGTMKDYDWAERDGEGLYTGVFSNYSEHDNALDHVIRLEVSGYFPLGRGLGASLWFGASLGWQRYAMQGMDGFYQYPPGSEPVPLTGKVISYTTDQVLPMIGLLAEWASTEINGSLELRGSIIGFERAYDQHHMRALDFIDYFFFLPSFELRASLGLTLSSDASWYLTGFFVIFPRVPGKSYMTEIASGLSYALTSEGGASSWFVGLETGVQFRFTD
jgi:outer membrane protease